jgi:hypothetical protein
MKYDKTLPSVLDLNSYRIDDTTSTYLSDLHMNCPQIYTVYGGLVALDYEYYDYLLCSCEPDFRRRNVTNSLEPTVCPYASLSSFLFNMCIVRYHLIALRALQEFIVQGDKQIGTLHLWLMCIPLPAGTILWTFWHAKIARIPMESTSPALPPLPFPYLSPCVYFNFP